MNEQANDTRSTVQDLAEMSRDKLACAQDSARDAFVTATDYIRANPWIAVGGAAVLGGVLAAMSRPKKASRHGNLDTVRDWLEDAYSNLPSQKQVQSMADSCCGVPDFFKQLRKKLHFN